MPPTFALLLQRMVIGLSLVPLWARLPMTRDDDLRPSVLRAAIAGLVSAIGCYGYHALKMFIPLFVVGIVLCTLPAWWRSLKTRRGALAIVVFLVSFWAAFGPLAFKFVTEPEIVGKRGQDVSLWKETDSTLQKIDKSSSRYVRHFGPDFLFVDGDDHVLGALPGPEGFVWRALPTLPGNGQFHWYMLPLMLAGCVAVLRRLKSSYAARIVLIYVLVYPIGDCLFRHHAYIRDSLHALRSSPGLCGLVLLAAFGIDEWRLWLKRLERTSVRFARVATRAVLAVFAASLVGLNVPFLYMYFNEYYERASVYDVFQADLIEACDWLQPRLDGVDAVFFTVLGMNMPYSPVLVRLAYDPVRWFHEPREFTNPTGKWDIYTRMGKLYFLYETLDARAAITRIRSENPDARILFVVRPDNPNFRTPIHTILRPDGQEALWICEL